jgi:hypothetical protein
MQNKIDHARILNAYLARMQLSDIDNIQAANRAWTQAAMNQGNSAQIQCQAAFYAAVANAVNNLIRTDISTIEQVINEETEGVTQ